MIERSKAFLKQIQEQRNFSDEIVSVVLPAIKNTYYGDVLPGRIACGDMGSYARGTNNENTPDVDIVFLNASRDESQGYKDWTPIGTRELVGRKEGITTLEELKLYDPITASLIIKLGIILEDFLELPRKSAQFNYFAHGRIIPVLFSIFLCHITDIDTWPSILQYAMHQVTMDWSTKLVLRNISSELWQI